MSISGVNEAWADVYRYADRTQKTVANGVSFTERLQKTREVADRSKADVHTEYLKQRNVFGGKETENKTNIIVKPDGSRVLVVTMSVGGMETTMSIEISKPAGMYNNDLKHDDNNGETPVSESSVKGGWEVHEV